MDATAIMGGIGLVRGAIELLRDAKDLVPGSQKAKAIELALKQAEQALQHAEVRLADDLGYNLCKCTFPPQVALRAPDGKMICPKCKRDTDEDHKPKLAHAVIGRRR